MSKTSQLLSSKRDGYMKPLDVVTWSGFVQELVIYGCWKRWVGLLLLKVPEHPTATFSVWLSEEKWFIKVEMLVGLPIQAI